MSRLHTYAWIILLLLSQSIRSQINFRDTASNIGLNTIYGTIIGNNQIGDIGAGGASFVDFNGDGWDDITLTTNKSQDVHFYRNDTGKFTKIAPLVTFKEETKQVNWVDYDNDGDKDLFVTSTTNGNRLYRNDGNLSFTDVTTSSRIGTTNYNSFMASWGDYDRDGNLDVYISNLLQDTLVSNILYKNNGNGTFSDVTTSAGIWDSSTYSFASAFVDINGDKYPDIYTTSDIQKRKNKLFLNNGDGTFTDISDSSNTDLGIDAMCTTVEDFDRDGDLDIYMTNTPSQGNKFLVNQGDTSFTESANSLGVNLKNWTWGSCFLDAENDGDMDLYVSGTYILSVAPSAFFENLGSGFTQQSNLGFLNDTMESHGNAVGDYDNDGMPDIVVNNMLSNAFLWTSIGPKANYLKVELEGVTSNRDGIGSYIEIYVDGNYQMKYTMCGEGYCSQNSQYESFGLDTASMVDSIVVSWISGYKDVVYNVSANQRIKIKEGDNPSMAEILANGKSISKIYVEICEGDTLHLSLDAMYDYMIWSTGDTASSIRVDTAGWYYVTAWNVNQNPSMDSIWVKTFNPGKFSIGPPDTTLCPGRKLSSNIFASSYLWNTGSRMPWKRIYSPGRYWLTAQKSFCTVSDTIDVTLHEVQDLDLGEDTFICVGVEYYLKPNGQWTDFMWSTGSDSSCALADSTKEYWLVTTDSNSCTAFDAINIYIVECTGIEEENASAVISAYPNPSSGKLTIKLDQVYDQLSADIMSIGGQLVTTETFRSTDQLDLEFKGERGIYFVLLRADGVQLAKLKILKD